MATPTYTKQDTSRTLTTNGNNVYAVWIPNGTNPYTAATFSGIDSTTSVPKGGGILCTLDSIEDVPLAALNEEIIQGIGKNPIKIVTGAQIEEFKMMIRGGDVRTLRILYGLDPSATGINAHKPLPDTGAPTGHLIVRKWSETAGIIISYIIPDLCIKFTSIGVGAEINTNSQQEVTFYKPQNGDTYICEGNKTISWGFWDLISGGAGTGVPTTAPDGVITTYVIGTGNVNGVAGATLTVPLLINDTVIGATSSNYKRYFIGVWLDGVLQTDAQVAYTTGTRTLTFTTAPALGASILAIYVADWASVLPENYVAASIVESELYAWHSYL